MDYRTDYRRKRRDDLEDASRKEARRAVRRRRRLHRIYPPRLARIRNDPGTFFKNARLRRMLLAHLDAHGVPLTSPPDVEKAKVAGITAVRMAVSNDLAAL